MSVEFDGESSGKFDSRTLNRKTLNRWTGRTTFPLFQTHKFEHDLPHPSWVYIKVISPRLIRTPPLGGDFFFTINLDGGTISPLIKYPPSEANIATINLNRGTINLDGGNKVIL